MRFNLIGFLGGLALHWLCLPLAMATSGVHLNLRGLGDSQRLEYTQNGSGLSFSQDHEINSLSSFYGLRPLYKWDSVSFGSGLERATVITVMNSNRRLTSGVPFFDRAGFSETVTDWSRVNGVGTVLATMALSLNNDSCMSFASYCKSLSAGMSGRPKSGGFSGDANEIGTDGQTSKGIPEPSMFYMLGSGLIGIFAARVRRAPPRPEGDDAHCLAPFGPGPSQAKHGEDRPPASKFLSRLRFYGR